MNFIEPLYIVQQLVFTRTKIQMLHKLIIGVVGIYSAYITMSLLSQKLYNHEYQSLHQGMPPAKFKYPPLMVWLGCLLCSIAGFIISIIKKQPNNPIILKQRIIMGILFTLNMGTTSYALLYISYPVQVIGRNIRFLFVVIIGAFFSRIRKLTTSLKLKKHKVFIAIIITVGVLLFNFAKQSKKDKVDKHDPKLEWIGFILLGVSVICDALFSDSQAYSKAIFKPTANHLFTITNFYAFIFCLAYSLILDDSFFASMQFLINYPACLLDIVSIGCLQVVGQISIYYIVSNFKQHIFPLISTTRKILTVIISIFVYNHYVNKYQWLAISLVFVGMFYEFYQEIKHQRQKDKKQIGSTDSSEEESLKEIPQNNKKQRTE